MGDLEGHVANSPALVSVHGSEMKSSLEPSKGTPLSATLQACPPAALTRIPGAGLLAWRTVLNGIDIPLVRLGGLNIAALDRRETAELMLRLARAPRPHGRPWILTSANGEVVSRCARDARIAALFAETDLISADGQPLVLASALCARQLPERVATTDLFHDVAALAVDHGLTFYMFGASDSENLRAVERIRRLYPGLAIVGRSHGYLTDSELEAKVAEINALAPDILWVALGVPREQEFALQYAASLPNVGMIKMSGGLFNFLSGTRRRAPLWMQHCGLEWLYRLAQEPRRLFWRYAVTNPHAAYMLLVHSA